MSQQLLLLLLLTSALLAYLISAIECGYGFSTTPYIDTTQYGLPPEGFSRVECKSANYCVYVTATPESFKLASLNLQFCDNEKGFLGRFIPSTLTCERTMQEPKGCTETVLTTSLIPFIPTNVTAEFCCCPKNLCNCNIWNPFSSVYCPPTPATKKSTTVVVTTTNSNPNISTTPIRQTTTIKPTSLTNVSKSLHCGFGYSTTPMKNTSGYGLPPQGFTQVECKSANYCVYVTARISSFKNISLNLQFCDNEIGYLKEFLPNNVTCKEAMQNNDHCYNTTVLNQHIPILPINFTMDAKFCCCATNLCNCNERNASSSVYCPAVKMSTTSQNPQSTASGGMSTTSQNPQSTTSGGLTVYAPTSFLLFMLSLVMSILMH